ncbi:uncharacterized protein [Temnothorax longispinosus]|uniref:uncharacterized protein isoform X2 n=1 Tax=Temnothorax longispinosus TaxID=300112 RepID=UPI003A99B41B
MSVANDSSSTPSKILIDKDLQSTAQEKEAADEVPSQFKSPAEIRGYPKAIHQYGTRKRRQQGSSKILTDSPEEKSLVKKKKKQEEKENKTRKRKPKKTSVIAPRKKRSKLWNYFKELKPLLVKCTTCKREIKVSSPGNCTNVMRRHLSRHGIFLDNDIRTLPDDLRQFYSELPGYKAKCNNCGETLSFLTDFKTLRIHLRRHSTRIQSRDETTPRKKRSKLWNYFEKLKPTLVKCTICKKKIKIPTSSTKRIQIIRAHLLKKHGISVDDDTLTRPDNLKQYYWELPGYKEKYNNCGETISFLTNTGPLRRHSTSVQGRDETVIMAPKRKRSKFWNYFEELKRSLVKCKKCKKHFHVTNKSQRIRKLKGHLCNVHGIYFDDDIRTLPDDLKQCYSKLPGYKAKCNNCGKTVSYLTGVGCLRKHLRRHSTIRIQSRDEADMVLRKKRGKFWNYFEELKPTLVKCTTCKKEIKVSYTTYYTKLMRLHLSRHGIFLNNDIRTLPDDLRQFYSELPGYKAKCNNCGVTLSFLTSIENLRKHLRRHSTRIQSRDKTVIMASKRKRSKLWNYFEELKPTLVKCTICKKEIKIPSSTTRRIKIIRAHLLKEHEISPDDDTFTLHDDLKQYYSQLPGYKAKCNNCNKTLSFFGNLTYLRDHLKKHSILLTSIQDRDKTTPKKKRSKLWNYFEELKPTLVKCTICKKKIKIPSSSTRRIQIIRAHLLKKHEISPDDDTFTLHDDLKQYYSQLPGYKAKCNNCNKTLSFFGNSRYLRDHLKKHSVLLTRIQSRDEPSTSSLAADIMDPSAHRQNQKTSGSLVQSFMKETTEKTDALNEPSTSITTGFDTNPTAECQSQESSGSSVQSFEQTRKETSTIDKTVIMAQKRKRSNFWNYFEDLNPSLVKCTTCKKEIKVSHLGNRIKIMRVHLFKKHGISLNNDTCTLPDDLEQYYSKLPGYKAKCNNCGTTVSFLTSIEDLRRHLRRHSTSIQGRDEPNTSSSTGRIMDFNAELQSQETINLALQSCEQSRNETRTRDGPNTSSSTGRIMDFNAELQSQETINLALQSCEQSRNETRTRDGPNTSSSTGRIMDFNAELQSQETINLALQSCEQSRNETRTCDGNIYSSASKSRTSTIWFTRSIIQRNGRKYRST